MPVGITVEDIVFSELALVDRPDHAAVLGRIFTSWSLIEGCITAILGLMMHTNHLAALALLESFKTNNSRVNAVRKIGAKMLDASLTHDFDKLMGDVLSYARERNNIAHGLWGAHKANPDLVYRMPMAAMSKFAIESPGNINNHNVDAIMEAFKNDIQEFTLNDLEELEKRGRLILQRVMKETTKKLYSRAAQNISSYSIKSYYADVLVRN